MNTHIGPPVLPPELLGYIINELRHNRQALINISLASRSFLPFCRPHLFRALKVPPARRPMAALRNSETRDQNHDMRRIVESHIAFHVRDLHIEISRISNTDLDPTALTSFLQSMTRVQSLNISAARSSQYGGRLLALLPSMRSSILDILRDCPIISVNVSNIIDFPILNLKYCRNLKSLVLEVPSIPDVISSLDELEYSEDRIELENLKISASSRLSRIPINVFTHPHSPLSISRLLYLGVCIRTLEDHGTCQLFVDNSMNTLRKFELWIFGPDHFHMLGPITLSTINLNSCSQLQCLSFHVPRSAVAPFLWLKDLFETIPNDNCVEEIRLSLSEDPSTGWRALDSTLSGTKFSGLKAVILPALPLRPKHKIPLLLSKGLVRVSQKEV